MEGAQLVNIDLLFTFTGKNSQDICDDEGKGIQILAKSIKTYGLLKPILVFPEDDKYLIIDGERRWAAAIIAEFQEVPIITRPYQESGPLSFCSNCFKDRLSPIEEARAFKRLLEKIPLSQKELGDRVGKSKNAIKRSLNLLKLAEQVQWMITDQQISPTHGQTLLATRDHERQYLLAQIIASAGLSVIDAKDLIQLSEEKTFQTCLELIFARKVLVKAIRKLTNQKQLHDLVVKTWLQPLKVSEIDDHTIYISMPDCISDIDMVMTDYYLPLCHLFYGIAGSAKKISYVPDNDHIHCDS